jgi:hypothetical protein
MFIRSLMFVSALAMLTTAGLAADGQPSKSKRGGKALISCSNVVKVEVAQSGASQSTSSSSFVDVAGSSIGFIVGGSVPSCVLVDFSAQAFAPATGTLMMVRALRDGGIGSVDGEIQLAAESASFSDAHAYNFLFTGVTPGFHTVKMQYRTFFAGDTVTINDFNMVVNHR